MKGQRKQRKSSAQLEDFLVILTIGLCKAKVSESRSVVSDSLRPRGLYSPWNSPGQDTGMDSLSLLQGIFPTQGSNPGLPHCRQILYQLSNKGSPGILEGVAYPFSDIPDPGIRPAFPALQADSLPTELSGKQIAKIIPSLKPFNESGLQCNIPEILRPLTTLILWPTHRCFLEGLFINVEFE